MGDELQHYSYQFYCRKCHQMKSLRELKEFPILESIPKECRLICTCGNTFFAIEKDYY